jgi:Amt family ammonium transporter
MSFSLSWRRKALIYTLLFLGFLTPGLSFAQDVGELKIGMDTMWVMIAGFLVFFMNLGFGMLESGLARSKNCVNICAKNFIVFAVSSIAFYVIGWGLMFGDGSNFVGTQGLFFVAGADNSPATGELYQGVYSAINWTGVPLMAKFFFQLVFAGTAATIVSGAVAERIKFSSFVVYSFFLVAFIYPVVGHWIWGGGWLADMGVLDFAGSSVVHSVGGWCALAGIIVLGPRIGKYGKDGKINSIPGHNMTSATLGCLVLWFGWFGFNPGSTMAVAPKAIAHIALTTNMAAAAGTLTAAITAWLLLKKPDLSMILNGCLAGLVAITAPCAMVSVGSAIVIGGIGGILVVFAVLFFDKIKIDDPVGATSVHLCNGIFGTLAVAIFGDQAICKEFTGFDLPTFGAQLTTVGAVAVFSFSLSMIVWLALKYTMGIRVTEEEEREGLDISEHGNVAYPDFMPSSSH